jgi:uncharacterized protein (TIGR02145 family)
MRYILQSLLLISTACYIMACHNQGAQQNLASNELGSIKMGDQIWAEANLDVVNFRNGDLIPEVRSAEEWEKAGKEKRPAWCYYENDSVKGKTYGRLYNWYAINDPRGISPNGWHVPTNEEWIALETHLGVPNAGLRLKCNKGWMNNGNGDNLGGFCLMPGGYRGRDGRFSGVGEFLYLSSSSEGKSEDSKEGKIPIWGRGVQFENTDAMRCLLDKEFGLYVRCIKDKR